MSIGSVAAATQPLLNRKPPQLVGGNRMSACSWSWAGSEMQPGA